MELPSILLAAALAAGPAAPAADALQAVIAPSDSVHAADLDERTRKAVNFPNERHRLYGSDSAAKGDWGDAMTHFTRAARYADKHSQHRISLMYWHGVGVPRDPALAYAWADLAAERMYRPSACCARRCGLHWTKPNARAPCAKAKRCMRSTAMTSPSRGWRP